MVDLKALSIAAMGNLQFDEPLEPGDERLVDLNDVRGDYHESRLLFDLGIAEPDGPASAVPESQFILFGGHRGCGKSTQLRQLAQTLNRDDRYCVVFVDALQTLDVNNLRYSDVVLAQAKGLLDKAKDNDIDIEQVYLTRLEKWFDKTLLQRSTTKDFGVEIQAGAKIKSGLPFLAVLFVKLQNAIKINSTYKEEIRREVRNHFAEFADAFNLLLKHVEEQVDARGMGRRILFIVDGTDRLQGEDSRRFFIDDVYQLQLLRACFVYCAPIVFLTEQSPHGFLVHRLPMIKIAEKGHDAALLPEPLSRLRDLVARRMSTSVFDDQKTVDCLIEYSGGHIRDLIRLLRYALREAQSKQVTQEMVMTAVKLLATEYSRLIEQNDYSLLVEIDQGPSDLAPVSEQSRRLLYDLVLLEYNSYWWQSHRAIRTLPAYQHARQQSAPQ